MALGSVAALGLVSSVSLVLELVDSELASGMVLVLEVAGSECPALELEMGLESASGLVSVLELVGS